MAGSRLSLNFLALYIECVPMPPVRRRPVAAVGHLLPDGHSSVPGPRGAFRPGVRPGLRGSVSLPFLALRRVARTRGRRPAAHASWTPRLHALGGPKRVLGGSTRKSLRQVSAHFHSEFVSLDYLPSLAWVTFIRLLFSFFYFIEANSVFTCVCIFVCSSVSLLVLR